MFTLFHKLYSKCIFRKPSVHYLRPKVLNLYFKNALNPSYQLIDLSILNNLILKVLPEKDKENNNIFVLKLIEIKNKENESNPSEYNIASVNFETRKEAETALMVLQNKLFSPEKTTLKFLSICGVILFLLTFLLAVVQTFVNTGSNNNGAVNQQVLQQLLQQQQQGNANPNANLPPVVNQVDNEAAYKQLQQAREQANKIIEEGTKQTPTSVGNIPNEAPIEVPQDPVMKDFINKLNK